ncbi:MAG TPA: hypothetical protein VMN43_05255 [Aestuariivirgaceae bacterium]|nr:hypothetical protein [Aestuariivirgaceae bacterium]
MSNHQPSTPDLDAEAALAPKNDDCTASQGATTDPLELDFSRLRMARDKLDNAFRAR